MENATFVYRRDRVSSTQREHYARQVRIETLRMGRLEGLAGTAHAPVAGSLGRDERRCRFGARRSAVKHQQESVLEIRDQEAVLQLERGREIAQRELAEAHARLRQAAHRKMRTAVQHHSTAILHRWWRPWSWATRNAQLRSQKAHRHHQYSVTYHVWSHWSRVVTFSRERTVQLKKNQVIHGACVIHTAAHRSKNQLGAALKNFSGCNV
ncbi:unnamed protein product [Scytosiphon promiscuus]